MNTLMHIPRNSLARPWNQDFDNLFEGFLRPARWTEEAVSEGLVPALDVIERDNEFIVKAEMPEIGRAHV